MAHLALEATSRRKIGLRIVSNEYGCYHLSLRDTRGVRPKFFADFNRSVVQVINAKYGWSGAVFKELSPPVVLHSAFAIVDKIAYTLANPVAAGAVRYVRDWPGLISRLVDMGVKRYGAKRPEHFFGKRRTLPDSSSFRLAMCPWLLSHYGSREAAMAALKARLKEHVSNARRTVKAKGWKFLGAKRVMRLSPFKRAKSYEVFGKLTPHFATIGLSVEASIAVKQMFLAWQARYDECRERFLRGESVIWPAGTWAMVQFFGQVAEPG